MDTQIEVFRCNILLFQFKMQVEIFNFQFNSFQDYKAQLLGQERSEKNELEKLKNITEHHTHQVNHLAELLYFILAEIYESPLSVTKLKQKAQNLFVAISTYQFFTSQDFQQMKDYAILHHLANLEYKTQEDDPKAILTITPAGKDYVKGFYLNMAQGTYWGKKFLQAKTVMIVTACCLLFLSIFKIIVANQFGSYGLLSEGLENLTDLVKIGIIAWGYKSKKDRLASLIIIAMMMVTGVSLLFTGIQSLIYITPIDTNKYLFLIVILSIIINGFLLFYKAFVGRMSGNLSLLSDSKDSQLNMLISMGVLIGLIFALFEIYWVDPIIGIFIALACLKEGGEIFYEIWKSGEDFDIHEFHVVIDDLIKSRLAVYFLHQLERKNFSKEDFISFFKTQIEISKKYFGGFANYFNENLTDLSTQHYLEKLTNSKYVKENRKNLLIITPQGKNYLSKKLDWEKKHKKRHQHLHSRSRFQRIFWVLFSWIMFGFILYIFFVWL